MASRLRTYRCGRYPRLKIGDAIAFSDGIFRTDFRSLQRIIESNDWFNVFIFDVTDAVVHEDAEDFDVKSLLADEEPNEPEGEKLTARKLAGMRVAELKDYCKKNGIEFPENATGNKLRLLIKKGIRV